MLLRRYAFPVTYMYVIGENKAAKEYKKPSLLTLARRASLCIGSGTGPGFIFLLLVSLHPFAGIDEGLNPRRYVVLTVVGGIVGVLPGEDASFQVRHHGQVTAVGRADTGYGVIRTVGVAGIFVV